MNKQDLIDNDIMTQEEIQEYEDLLVLEKFYTLINEQIEIGSEDKEPVAKKHYYYFDKGRNKFRVQVTIDGQKRTVGQYPTEEQAIDKVEQLKKDGVL